MRQFDQTKIGNIISAHTAGKSEHLGYFINELNAIIHKGAWFGTRGINEVRYRIHRFLAILNSSRIRLGSLSGRWIEYWTAFPNRDSRRQVENVIKDHLKDKLTEKSKDSKAGIIQACLGLIELLPITENESLFNAKIRWISDMVDFMMNSWTNAWDDIAKEFFEEILANLISNPEAMQTGTAQLLLLKSIVPLIGVIRLEEANVIVFCDNRRYAELLGELLQKASSAVLNGGTDESAKILRVFNQHAAHVPPEDPCPTYKERSYKLESLRVDDLIVGFDNSFLMSIKVIPDVTGSVWAFQSFKSLAITFDKIAAWYFRANFRDGGYNYLELVANQAKIFGHQLIDPVVLS